jgi:hypothetical protein
LQNSQLNSNKTRQPDSPTLIAAQTQNLRYPGKVLAVERQENLPHNLVVISDSANNRLVVINEETLECDFIIGNGKVGLVDGSYTEA